MPISFDCARTRAILTYIGVAALACACARDPQSQSTERSASRPDTYDAAGEVGSNISPQALPNFAPLVERYGPAVVNVEVIQASRGELGSMTEGDPLFEFFRRFGIPVPGDPQDPGAPPERGAGSGFIVSPDGYIITNAHVVAEADEVTVRLTDRREFAAKVIGVDTYTDIALIKIEATDLPTVRIGDPNRLRPGEWVVAIGSPFGLENSATAGIVSATSRAVSGNTPVPFIQTDVAVNPGNSGGPLFNMQGEVVGVNSMIFSRTGGYMGLSFAIPIDVAVNVRDQLMTSGRVVRGRIGVVVQEMTAPLAESFGLDKPHGALVSSVEPNGPADQAGIKSGDVILGVAGRPVEQSVDVSRAIAGTKPGTQTELDVWRSGKRQTIKVKVGEMESGEARVAQRRAGEETMEKAKLGLTIRPLSPEERRLAGTDGKLLVQQATGPAARAGLQRGDIIIGIAGERIETIEQLRAKTKNLKPNDSIALLVERNGEQIFVPIRVG
jgi:serine protease Do